MEMDSIYSFVFKGLLTEEALDLAGRKIKRNFSGDWEDETSQRLGIPLLNEELVVKSRKMAIVYIAICSFENSVREFIEKKLFEEKGINWWDLVVIKKEIRDKAENRKESENDVRWLTPRGNSLIYYTEFGDLLSIMWNSWDFFEIHIKDIDWAKQIITTLEKSRNIIMHSGELNQSDIERVGMYIRDWVKQVG